jgi:hypothetical protein
MMRIKSTLGTLSNYATIFGFLTSLFFAIYAILLTYKIERTDKKVLLLESINSSSETQIQKMIILIEQIQKSQVQNMLMINQLIEQKIIQGEHLKTENSQLNITKNKQVFDSLKNRLVYLNLKDKLRLAMVDNIIFNTNQFILSSIIEKRKALDLIIDLLNQITENPIVISNKRLYDNWYDYKLYFMGFAEQANYYSDFTNKNYSDSMKINIYWDKFNQPIGKVIDKYLTIENGSP